MYYRDDANECGHDAPCEVCGEPADSTHYGAAICSDACLVELMDAVREDMAVIDAGKVRPGPRWEQFCDGTGEWDVEAPVYDDSIPF